MRKIVEPFCLSEVEIMIDDSLGFTQKAFGCFSQKAIPSTLNTGVLLEISPYVGL